MTDEKALDKIDIAGELKTLSPIEKKSLELKARAVALTVTDKATYTEAKKLKREFVSHRTETKSLRLTFTRKLDNLKDQFIKKQDEVLEPSIAGESLVKQQIEDWEKAEAERKAAEEKRIADIVDTIMLHSKGLSPKDTPDTIKRCRAAIKMELSLLEPKDRTRVAVKTAVSDANESLDQMEAFINERIDHERIAEE